MAFISFYNITSPLFSITLPGSLERITSLEFVGHPPQCCKPNEHNRVEDHGNGHERSFSDSSVIHSWDSVLALPLCEFIPFRPVNQTNTGGCNQSGTRLPSKSKGPRGHEASKQTSLSDGQTHVQRN